MNARTEVPEWCRTDVEDAIGDAVTRWVLNRVDQMGENATPTNALSVIFALTSGDRQEVARDVIAALQGVGVPFSGATGAGAKYEAEPPPMVCRTCGVTSENWRHDETAPVEYFTDNGQCHPCYVSKGKPT